MMVTSTAEHSMQADVVFLIESTAANGAYFNDFKTNYIIPTLEYFSQGGIEDREYASETSLTLYGVITYNASDCLPSPFTNTYGPFSNPHKVILTLERLEMVGGKAEQYANIGEGLATALQCFEDLQVRREPSVASQKHCILVCNSAPYQVGVQESYTFSGYSVEQLAAVFQERNISLSILSPRKIAPLFKLFEKAGGDLAASQSKNFAKDPRHLVLLRNYNLKESPVSPTTAACAATAVPGVPPGNAQIALSPLQSNDSPNPNQTPQSMNVVNAQSVTQQQAQQQQGPPTTFRGQTTPQNINSVHQQQQAVSQQQQQQPTSTSMASRPQFTSQISAPPNYHAAPMGPRPPHPARAGWMRPPFAMNPGGPGAGPGAPAGAAAQQQPPTSTQSSALIAQLSQPPTAMGLNVQSFPQRMEGAPTAGMAANTQQAQQQQQQQQQQQLNQHQQQQLRQQQLNMQQQLQQQNIVQQQNAQQNQMSMQAQASVAQQNTQQINVSSVNQSMGSQVPQTVTASQASSVQTASASVQMTHAQQGNNPSGPAPQPVSADRTVIWRGMLEWVEKNKTPNDAQKQTWQVPCQISAAHKDGEPEVKAESWPMKLIMQLMPKVLIGNIGQAYLKNSKSVVFYPSACDALESLIKVMSNGFAGCVHFTQTAACNIKVLLLLYTAEKRTFIGFIPNDQQAFVDRLRKVIQQQKISHNNMVRQGPVALRPTAPGTGPGGANANVMSSGVTSTGISSQSGITMMSQTNTMTMGGGQITQNVIANNAIPQQSLASSSVQQQNQLNIQPVGLQQGAGGPQAQMNNTGNAMVGQHQQQIEMARQQNLLKIHQLQATLEAAQQQEAQYKSQEAQYKSQMESQIGNIQQNLEHAQAQEMQYKQIEAQQAQRGLNPGPVQMQNPQQANAQRLMRPVNMGNIGLRHLLQQQQQPQYRQVLGMQQQMVGPRGQMAPRAMAPNNPQNQQFDEVSNFDFLG